jgi:hypothetical protein
MCVSEAHAQNDVCDFCYKHGRVKFISKCRTCGEIFDSRNKLFAHLKAFSAHLKAFERDVESRVFNSWIEEYWIVGCRR